MGVGANFLTFASWNVSAEGADLVTTNFESWDNPVSETFDEGILGPLSAKLDFGGDWDAGTNPIDFSAGTPPGLYPRDDLAAVLLYTSRLDNVFWNFPYVRVRSVKTGAQWDQKVSFSVDNAMNQGPFTFPTGDA